MNVNGFPPADSRQRDKGLTANDCIDNNRVRTGQIETESDSVNP